MTSEVIKGINTNIYLQNIFDIYDLQCTTSLQILMKFMHGFFITDNFLAVKSIIF